MLPGMAAARLAAALLVVLATAVPAQNKASSPLVVTVVDHTGAVIPGAHVGGVQLPAEPHHFDWFQYASTAPEQTSTQTDIVGEATVVLMNGSYALRIWFRDGDFISTSSTFETVRVSPFGPPSSIQPCSWPGLGPSRPRFR